MRPLTVERGICFVFGARFDDVECIRSLEEKAHKTMDIAIAESKCYDFELHDDGVGYVMLGKTLLTSIL